MIEMERFLRLFATFRELENNCREKSEQNIVLQDRQRWLESEIDRLREQNQKVVDEALHGAKLNADFVAQMTLGRTIYGLAPKVGEPIESEIVKREGVSAREIQREMMSPEHMLEELERDLGIEHDAPKT